MLLYLVTVNGPNIDNPDVGLYGEHADPKRVLEDIRSHAGNNLYYRNSTPELSKDAPVFSLGVSGEWITDEGINPARFEVNVYSLDVILLPIFRVRAFAYELPASKYRVLFDEEAEFSSLHRAKEAAANWQNRIATNPMVAQDKGAGWTKIFQVVVSSNGRLVNGTIMDQWEYEPK